MYATFILDDFTKKTDQVGSTSIYLFNNDLWNIVLPAQVHIPCTTPRGFSKGIYSMNTQKKKKEKWKKEIKTPGKWGENSFLHLMIYLIIIQTSILHAIA